MVRKKTGPLKIKGGNDNTDAGDGVFVSIQCSGTSGTPHEKWRIASFAADVVNGDIVWSESVSGYAEPGAHSLIKVFPPVTQWLDGDKFISQDDYDPMVFYKDTFRTSWLLRCPTCKYAHKVSPPSSAYPLLTALAQAHIKEISVRGFAKRAQLAS